MQKAQFKHILWNVNVQIATVCFCAVCTLQLHIFTQFFWAVCFSFHCKISLEPSFLTQNNSLQYLCRFYTKLLLHIIESQLMVSKVLFESLQLKNDAIFSIKICYRCNQVSIYILDVLWGQPITLIMEWPYFFIFWFPQVSAGPQKQKH